jgi:hypothetical protein
VPRGEEEPQVLVEAQPDAGLTHRPSIASAGTAAAGAVPRVSAGAAE